MIKTCGTASSFFAVAASAIGTLPNRRALGEALILFALFSLLATYIGTSTALFKFSMTGDWAELAVLTIIAVFIPALGEELVFRVALAGRTDVLRAALALVVFVIWHPIQVWLGLPMAQPAFLAPAFLIIAGMLGLVCTISWRRSGSIWPAVAMHWVVVIVWKGFTVPA
jgi:predicted Abi (CAAX) family protease